MDELETIQAQINELSNFITGAQKSPHVQELEERMRVLQQIILGDKELNIMPINDRLMGIETTVKAMKKTDDKRTNIMWGIGIGLTANAAGIGAVLIKLFA